jgi:hypothetical protein
MVSFKKPLALIFNKKNLVPFIALIIVVSSGIGIYLYSKDGSIFDFGLNSKIADSDIEAERVVKEVGEIYLLPDEIPIIATVSDKTQLSNQTFFERSENGDKVLIYRTAGLAILYRPKIGKIINVGPVNLKDGEIEDASVEKEVASVGVLILNGTTTVGLTKIAADKLADLDFMSVSDRLDAENKPYEESIVVYLKEEFKPQAEIIAASLSAQVSNELLEGEESNDAGIVIILGEDFASE